MENAVDAFVMAGSVLLLIIALSVSISSFTSLKSQVDDILSIEDETDLATYTDNSGNTVYLNYVQGASMIREVTAETVISAIRRISKENYDIYIIGNCITTNTQGLEDIFNKWTNKYYYTSGQLYQIGSTAGTGQTLALSQVYSSQSQDVLYLTISGQGYRLITNENVEKIYKTIKDVKFEEYIGIWQYGTDVSDANKTTYRIITYVQT